MSSHTRCDRCGRESETRECWHQLADLCFECRESFSTWWARGKRERHRVEVARTRELIARVHPRRLIGVRS